MSQRLAAIAGSVAGTIVLALAGTAAAQLPPGLYGVSSSDDEEAALFRIDPATGAATFLVDLSVNTSLVGATFLDDELYISDALAFNPNNWYGTVDPATGVYTGIHGQLQDLNWHGLASSESLGVTWSISQQNNRTLVETDLAGNITSIGPAGIDGRGMAYDDANGILYAVNFEDGSLYTVDTTTAQSTLVGPLGIPSDAIGLAYDEVNQTLYLTEGDVTDSLYTVDVNTGAATLVGPLGHHFVDGLAWLAPIPEPTSAGLLAIGSLALLRRRRGR